MSTRFFFICIVLVALFFSGNCLALEPWYRKDTLLSKLEKENDIIKRFNLLCELSEVYQDFSTKESIAFAEKALQIADSLNLATERARALNLLGVSWKNAGNNMKSDELLTEALNIYQQTKSQLGQAEVLRNIGESYRAGGDMEKSVSYLNKALEIFQKEKDTTGLAKTYNRLAATNLEIYYGMEDYVRLDTDTNLSVNDFLVAVSKNKKLRSRLDSLILFINLSLHYSEKLGMTDVRISSEILKSALNSSNHNYEEALEGYLKTLRFVETSEHQLELPLILYNISNLYYRSGKIDEAIEFGEKGLAIAVEQDINTYIMMISQMLHQYYHLKENDQKAYYYLLLNNQARDKFMKNDVDLRIKSMQSDFRIAEKELQIQNKKKTNQLLIISFSLIICVVFGFTLILIKKNKKQRLLNRDLQKKNLLISEKNSELAITNSEKDKFISILAHDVRSPLSSFIGLTEYIHENYNSISPADLQDFTSKMNTSARNLFELLSNLLDWSRMQRGLITFDPGILVLHDLAKVTLDSVIDAANRKQVELKTDISEGITVFADLNMLATVLRNLLSNAVKFTPSGGRVVLSAHKTNDGKTVISVEDNGIGIPGELINKLFQLNGGASRKGTDGEPSNGLGLLICRDFIERHGGRINVESTEGQGTIFRVTIDSEDKNL